MAWDFFCVFDNRSPDRSSDPSSGNSSGSWNRPVVPLFYDRIYYEKYLGCLIGENMIQWGVAGFTAVSMTGVFVLFSKRKKYTALKVGFVLLNAFLLLPYAGHVLNGFSYVSNRWIWAYGMLIAYIFVKIYPDLFTLTLKEKRRIS